MLFIQFIDNEKFESYETGIYITVNNTISKQIPS